MGLDVGGSVRAELKDVVMWELGSEQGVQEYVTGTGRGCAGVGLPAPLLTCCMTSDKSPDLACLISLSGKAGMQSTYPMGLLRLNGIVHVKCWSQCLVHSGCISIGIALRLL